MERKACYRRRGSILPMVAIGLIVFAAFLAFTFDIMRTVSAKSAMNYACKAAALAAYAFDPNESRIVNNASADLFNNPNLVQIITETLSNQSTVYQLPKNMVPFGPDFTANVAFLPATFQFGANNLNVNPADNTETFLTVPMQTAQTNGLQMFFLPAMFMSNWSDTATATQMSNPGLAANDEVVGQPASRIGAGPSANQIAINPSLAAFADCVVFPLAITYSDFINSVVNSSAGSRFFLTLNSNLNSNSSGWQQAPTSTYPALRAAFVDVVGFPSKSTYYDYNAADNIQDLQNVLGYFLPGFLGTAPGCIERGSNLAVIDPASLSNQQLSSITSNLTKLQNSTKRYFILPIVSQNLPGSPGVASTVVGFAIMKSQNLVSLSSGKIQFVFSAVGSIPIKNATSSNDLAAVPSAFNGSNKFAPAIPPIFPFGARQFNQANNALSVRPISVALAPSLSPRSPFHFFAF